MLRAARFTIDDSVTPNIIPGFTFGSTWNGWACPYFTREAGEALAATLAKTLADCEPEARLWWDDGKQAFLLVDGNEPDEPQAFGGEAHTLPDGTTATLYAIGHSYWTWDEVSS